MNLPDPVRVSDAALAVIVERHGLSSASIEALPVAGIINTVYALGDDLVLRVPRNHPTHVDHAYREAAAIPQAVVAGVRTPGLIAFDDARDILPVPYLIVERVLGVNHESLDLDPKHDPEVWSALGRDLAQLHAIARPEPTDSFTTKDEFADPRLLVEQRTQDGWFSLLELCWLLRWLERLAPLATRPVPGRFVHADVQMSNLPVEPATGGYLALIDWGCAHWQDCAFDFLSMPLQAVPFLLAGHREVAPLDEDDAAEARILWRLLQLLLNSLPRGAAKDCSWGERPVAWLVDLFRFFLDPPNAHWREIGPSEAIS